MLEDAAEALGSFAGKRHAGSIGEAGILSYNGNKPVTTGGGGMLITNNNELADRVRHLSTTAKKAHAYKFEHDEVGYNYRLTNLQAALGLAQLEQVEGFIAHKHRLYDCYQKALDGKNGYRLLPFCDGIRANKWFFSLHLGERAGERDAFIAKLQAQRIQTRPVWALIHEQADYGKNELYAAEKAQFYRAGIVNLPCSTNLTLQDAERVADAILAL